MAKDLGLKIHFDDTLPFGKNGRTFQSGEIIYKKSFLERDINNDKKASVLLHELIHAVTMYALSEDTANWKVPKDLENFRKEINNVFNELRYNPAIKDMYGAKDVREFVAELANPVFREALQKIDAEKVNQKKSVWQKILDAFKSLLGIHTSSTYYQRSMNTLDKALNAFDMDTYLEYTGNKDTLRQAYNDHRVEFKDMTTDELKTMLKKAINEDSSRLTQKDNSNNGYDIEQGLQRGGKVLEETFNLLQKERGRNDEGDAGKTNEGKSLRARIHEEASKQQQQLIEWAKKNNELIIEPNDYLDEVFGESNLKGSESKVWVNVNNGTVIKSIKPNHYANVRALIERIAIHNTLFPTTTITLHGIGVSDNGISLIVEQPFVEDSNNIPSFKEIEDYMASLGFTHTKGKGVNAEYVKDNFLVSDIRPENVIKQPDGQLKIIDCFAKINENQSTDNKLSSLIDSMSREQLVSELERISQEYADYDEAYESKRQTPRGKSRFTFNDGTTLSVPFTPNGQQAYALNVMNDFIKSDNPNETSMTLAGYAGTGKTSLMEILAKKAIKDGNCIIMFSATTNKATAVLNSKVAKIGFSAQTLNKLFGINVEVDTTQDYDAKNLVNKIREVDIPYGTTVVIDEASMINEENYRTINKVAKEKGLKIIYVGDKAQLAPVNEEKISIVFRNTDGKVVELTQVERTADNAILKEATNIRNGKPLSNISSFNDKGEGVAFTKSAQTVNDVIKYYAERIKNNPDFFKILAYHVDVVANYNERVRKLLGYQGEAPRVGEPMMGYTNWGYDYKTRTYQFINSEAYAVTKVESPKQVSLNVQNHNIKLTVIPVTLKDSFGNIKTFNYIDIKENAANREAVKYLASVKDSLWKTLLALPKSARKPYYN